MGKANLIEEAKEHVKRVIIPSTNPNVSGLFQVRLIGIVNNIAEIELRIVEPETKDVLKSFGSKAITIGKTITLEGLESRINFLPGDFEK